MPIVENDSNKICYETYGESSNPCLILVMGITGQLINWPENFINGLVRAGFYVVAFDNRDVGFSKYYDDLATPTLNDAMQSLQQGKSIALPYTLNDMANDILFLMDQLSIDKAHLLGISMGGQVAQLFAIEHQDRLHSLILVATTSGDKGLPPPTDEVLNYFFKPKQNDDLESLVANHLEQYKIYTHGDDFDFTTAESLLKSAYQRAFHPPGNQRQLLATMFAKPRGEQLKNVRVPTLIIHGDYDPVFPIEHGQQLAAVLPASKLAMIDKMGHGLPTRVAMLVVEAIGSLTVVVSPDGIEL